MTPTHASKNGVRYRYYVSQTLISARPEKSDGGNKTVPAGIASTGQRLPAAGIERLVFEQLTAFLATPSKVIEAVASGDDLDDPHRRPTDAADQQLLLRAAAHQGSSLATADAVTQRNLLLAIVQRVTVHRDRVEIRIKHGALIRVLSGNADASVQIAAPHDALTAPQPDDGSGVTDPNKQPIGEHLDSVDQGSVTLTIPVAFRRSGFELRLVIPGNAVAAAAPDQSLVRILARAHAIRDQLIADPTLSIAVLADREQVTTSYATRLLRLTFLAPDIVTALLEGRQPVELTANKLMADTRLPVDWVEQRRATGFG